eukprot:4280051-Pyramimonas_sp.AAC.1
MRAIKCGHVTARALRAHIADAPARLPTCSDNARRARAIDICTYGFTHARADLHDMCVFNYNDMSLIDDICVAAAVSAYVALIHPVLLCISALTVDMPTTSNDAARKVMKRPKTKAKSKAKCQPRPKQMIKTK